MMRPTVTKDQVQALRERWRSRAPADPCRHYQLELLWTAQGESMLTYACILCGEEVCQVSPADRGIGT